VRVPDPVLELVRGGAIAVTKAVEALQDGDIEYARELVGIADEHIAPALELPEREAA
jgi:hypothetical protein